MAILTVKQAAEHLQNVFSEFVIYDMVRKGQMPTIRISGRKVLFNSERLDEWIANDCVMKDEWKRANQSERPSSYGKLRQLEP